MVKQLETELPSRDRRAPRSRSPGTRCCCTATTCCSTASRSKLSPAPFAVLQALVVNPGHVVSRRDLLGRAAVRAPPAPSTPSRWRSPGCAPPLGTRCVQTVVKRGYRLAVGQRHEAGDRRARHPAPPPATRSPRDLTAAAGARLGLPATAAYVELCPPSLRRGAARRRTSRRSSSRCCCRRATTSGTTCPPRVAAAAGPVVLGPRARAAPAAGRGPGRPAAPRRCGAGSAGGDGGRRVARPARRARPDRAGRLPRRAVARAGPVATLGGPGTRPGDVVTPGRRGLAVPAGRRPLRRPAA